MNPLTNVKNINKLNELEAEYGVSSSASWHQQYKDSAYIFIGGLPYELTEGDVLCVFSQYGEIVNINLVRDKKTGKSKGYCFIAYEDQRSTVLAVDNLNGIRLKGRTLRVDHVSEYRKPKDDEEIDEETKRLREEGCAPKTPPSQSEEEEEELILPIKEKGHGEKKKKKKAKKEKKPHKKLDSDGSYSIPAKIKKEKVVDEKHGMNGRGRDERANEIFRVGDRNDESQLAGKEDRMKGRESKDTFKDRDRTYFNQRDREDKGKRENERRHYRDRSESAEREHEKGHEKDRRGRDRRREERKDREGGKGKDRDRMNDRSDRYRKNDYRERSRERERIGDRDKYR